MMKQSMNAKESAGLLNVPIGRTGDISDVIKVICFTESGNGISFILSQSPGDWFILIVVILICVLKRCK